VATVSSSAAQLEQLTRQHGMARKPRSLWADAWARLLRNRAAVAGMIVIVLFYLMAYLAPLLAPYNPNRVFQGSVMKEPGFVDAQGHQFLLGTDQIGRDLLSRLVYGSRISMLVGLIPVTITLAIGSTFGMLAGMRGGAIDNVMMRIADVFYAFPALLFLIIIVTAFRETEFGNIQNGLLIIFFALSIVGWEGVARLVRGQVLQVKEREFVEAARTIGVGDVRIAIRHVFPNVLSPLIVGVAFAVPGAIFAEAGLSFLGIGIRPPAASWGSMIQAGLGNILNAWWLTAAPAAMIAIVMLSFTFLGDGLRDALDPRMK
jgi:ABC-type dipeptide/oligopeptide/nickel transport system permease subunit